MRNDDLTREIERFLYREARLLDGGRFRDWLDLFTDDVHYLMVTHTNRYPRRSKAIAILAPNRYSEDDRDEAVAVFDETKETLTNRVVRLETGMAWAEDPPSRTRHFVGNVEIDSGAGANEITVHANFIVYRSRGETEEDFYVGGRQDVLRRVAGEWKIARRRLVLDQNILSAKNLSVFF